MFSYFHTDDTAAGQRAEMEEHLLLAAMERDRVQGALDERAADLAAHREMMGDPHFCDWCADRISADRDLAADRVTL